MGITQLYWAFSTSLNMLYFGVIIAGIAYGMIWAM